MPRSVSPSALRLIAPIIERIDDEVAKPTSERRNFYLEDIQEPERLKNVLTTYKTQYRREQWNGQFTMRVNIKHKRIAVEFDDTTAIHFLIRNEASPEETYAIRNSDGSGTSDPLPQDWNDKQAAEEIFMNSPNILTLNLNFLSEDTKNFLLSDGPPTALVNAWQRHGYTHEIRNNRVRLNRG